MTQSYKQISDEEPLLQQIVLLNSDDARVGTRPTIMLDSYIPLHNPYADYFPPLESALKYYNNFAEFLQCPLFSQSLYHIFKNIYFTPFAYLAYSDHPNPSYADTIQMFLYQAAGITPMHPNRLLPCQLN